MLQLKHVISETLYQLKNIISNHVLHFIIKHISKRSKL